MSEFDLTPPSLPGSAKQEQKGGFLKKLFRKNEEPAPPTEMPTPRPPPAVVATPEPVTAAPAPEQFDLDEIKRKLGLSDDDEPTQKVVPPPVVAPAPLGRVEVSDWTSEDSTVVPVTNDWSQESKDNGIADTEVLINEHDTTAEVVTPTSEPASAEHHELVDAHLATLYKAEEKITQTIEQAAERPQLPEWKLQEKEITPEQYFILRNGQPVKSLRELIDILEYIDDSTFEHHVNEFRNDFANWVRDVIQDGALADEIQDKNTKTDMVRALLSHERGAAKQTLKEQEQLQDVVRKRKETLKKLGSVEQQIDDLKAQLQNKMQELAGERKRNAKLIKEKLDEVVQKQLGDERKALAQARKNLAQAKQEYLNKKHEFEEKIDTIADREKAILEKNEKNATVLKQLQDERAKLAKDKQEAHDLMKDANSVRKQYEDAKTLNDQAKKNLEVISKKEIELSRREETLRQREQKINADLTRVHDEQETLKKLKDDHTSREATAKKIEAESKKAAAEAESRTKAALEQERSSKERLRTELKKLEDLRQKVDKALAKALGEKKKITNAVALRKHLEESLGVMKSEVVAERQEMEKEAYKTYFTVQEDTTPVGQPASDNSDEVLKSGKNTADLYERITLCRTALEHKDIETARRVYNELREQYANAKLDTSEKSALYNSIRELYDDIHLAMLG